MNEIQELPEWRVEVRAYRVDLHCPECGGLLECYKSERVSPGPWVYTHRCTVEPNHPRVLSHQQSGRIEFKERT